MTTIVITAMLLFPLSASSLEIVREATIETEIRHELTTNTVTFQRVSLIDASFDWYQKPLHLRLTVSAEAPVTASQIRDLERFVQRRTRQHVRIVMFVNHIPTVTDGQDATSDPVKAISGTGWCGAGYPDALSVDREVASRSARNCSA